MLKGKKCPREGTKVRANVNPASALLYSPGHAPSNGMIGTVTTVPLPGGKKTCMNGPGGGLVYVKWSDGRTFGVSRLDVNQISPREAARSAMKRMEPLGPWGGLGYPEDGHDVLKQYKKCLRKCKKESPKSVIPCLDECNGVQSGVSGTFAGLGAPRQSKAEKALDKEIERIYYANAQGVQINIMDIGKIFRAGRDAHARGEPMEPAIIAAIQATRVNGFGCPDDQVGMIPGRYGTDSTPDTGGPQWAVVDTRSGVTRYHWFTDRRDAEVFNAQHNAGFVQSATELNLRPWEQPGFEGLGIHYDRKHPGPSTPAWVQNLGPEKPSACPTCGGTDSPLLFTTVLGWECQACRQHRLKHHTKPPRR